MSFLSEEENRSLSISRMILHVVGGEEDFEPQEELIDRQHESFFLDRIRGAAADAVHSFSPGSETKARLEEMATGVLDFQVGGQRLARAFSGAHVEASVSGAFFVFELAVGTEDTVLFALVKYDYRNVLEFTSAGGRQTLRAIVQAFVTERRAIQKSCLVRVIRGGAEDAVSAADRMGAGSDLTDYFQKFLDVRRARSDLELSGNLNEALRSALSAFRERLPGRDVVAALEASKESLRGRERVDESAIREALFVGAGRPEDESSRAELERIATLEIRRRRLTGVEFRPSPGVLAQRARRQIKTAESVLLTYPGEEDGKSVSRERQPGGGWTITITTQRDLLEDGTLAAVKVR